MSNFEAKRGSALLIVLGFLSFMVVSAVAFAVYMRAERKPSSALRRNVAIRHLVEAALAQAMSRVDDAVRGDVFPGLCETNDQASCYRDRNGCAYDWWEGRVFMPPDPEGSTLVNKEETRFAPAAETVSVLNLEALGYLPPALINDVRFLSRSSWAAKWEYFNYDAGRYAFCAVNVSDFFDVNRLSAGPRTSDEPVSLAYLFADNNKTAPGASLMSSFERLSETQRPGGNDGTSVSSVPYVSLLDYNLAFGKLYNSGFGSSATFESPFWMWINNKPNAQSGYMYMHNTYSSGAAQLVGAERQTFVTDSWQPADAVTMELLNGSGENQKIPDLADSDENSKHYGQPFKMSELRNSNSMDVERVLERSQTKVLPFWCDYQKNGETKGLLHHFGSYDALCLWDYLDRDNVPLSLALPCAERVPMICSVQSAVGNPGDKLLSVKKGASSEEGTETITVTTEYTLENILQNVSDPHVRAVIAYPFKGFDSETYKAKAYAQLHITALTANAGTMPARVHHNAITMREYLDNGWDDNSSQMFKNDAFLFTLTGDNEASVQVESPEREADIFFEPSTRLMLRKPGANSKPIVRKTELYRGERQGEQWVKKDKLSTKYTLLVDAIDADGNAAGLAGTEMEDTDFAGKQFVASLAVWVRLANSNNRFVDLMPATYQDDDGRVLGGGAEGSSHFAEENAAGPIDRPGMLRFVLSQAFSFADIVAQVDAGGDGVEVPCVEVAAEPTPCVYMAVDPRFNWAPEDLLALTKAELGANEMTGPIWLNKVFGSSGYVRECGQGEPDVDPFMFVSNQGYLQSMGELAFLPKLNDGNGQELMSGAYNGLPRTGAADLLHRRSMWQGNPILGVDGRQTVYDWGVENGGGAFKVNPFTDNFNVFFGAIANTPMNYWASGTNYVSGTGVDSIDASEKKSMLDSVSTWKKYAVGPDNDFGLDIRYDDLRTLAAGLQNTMRAAGLTRGSWQAAYNALWDSEDGLFYKNIGENESAAREFLGMNLGNVHLHGADRKALYSFWRDSFANRQQLFLIFVRAESTALGGAGEGTPAQQGGRAVALVWRDPASPTGQDVHESVNDNYEKRRHPHKMRVLFYHQFD